MFDTVVTNMLHGPCGNRNPICPCMERGECTEKFPKTVSFENNEYPDKSDIIEENCAQTRQRFKEIANEVSLAENFEGKINTEDKDNVHYSEIKIRKDNEEECNEATNQ